MESCSRIKDVNGSWHKERMKYFEDVYNLDTQEQVAISMCDFNRICRDNYFGGKPLGRAEVQVRVEKLKNGKAAAKDEITGEMIKGGGSRVVDWI